MRLKEDRKQNYSFRSIMKRRWRTPLQEYWKHHHGAGGYYRQCFYDHELDYRKYDEMFYHTVAEDTEETAVELALNRLRFPAELSDKNRQGYEEYLKAHDCGGKMDGEAGRGGRNPVPAKKKIMDRTIFTGGNGFRGRR